jgi:hypothetical protein
MRESQGLGERLTKRLTQASLMGTWKESTCEVAATLHAVLQGRPRLQLTSSGMRMHRAGSWVMRRTVYFFLLISLDGSQASKRKGDMSARRAGLFARPHFP